MMFESHWLREVNIVLKYYLDIFQNQKLKTYTNLLKPLKSKKGSGGGNYRV